MAQQFQKAVDSLFAKLGKAAKYHNRDILIFLLCPDDVVSVGFVQAHTATNIMKIRISDAPELQIGDEIIVDNQIFRISVEPRKDAHNLIWTADLYV